MSYSLCRASQPQGVAVGYLIRRYPTSEGMVNKIVAVFNEEEEFKQFQLHLIRATLPPVLCDTILIEQVRSEVAAHDHYQALPVPVAQEVVAIPCRVCKRILATESEHKHRETCECLSCRTKCFGVGTAGCTP